MKPSVIVSIAWFVLLSCFIATAAMAANARPAPVDGLSHPDDPRNRLPHIKQRGTQKESFFAASPLTGLHDSAAKAKQELYEASSLKLGLVLTHLFQNLSESKSGEDDFGQSSQANIVGTWELFDKGTPTQGQVYFDVEGRWEYGNPGPSTLGSAGLGTSIGTANGYAEYTPTFLVRNLYWHQGSRQAGWSYRLGKITPDQILSTSAHISPFATFLPTASTGPFAMGLPDSGYGTVGALYVNDRATLVGLVSDANADRTDSGDIGEGDLFTAVEIQYKIAPRTSKAGYSKLTLWNTDGTKDGVPINGEQGPSGAGYMGKLELELSDDGRAIGILRYGKSYNDSALYEELASAHFLLYEPPGTDQLKNDLVGVALTWAAVPQTEAQNEENLELFYRFPIFPHVDATLSYQSVFNPAYDRDNDQASVYSFRLRTSF